MDNWLCETPDERDGTFIGVCKNGPPWTIGGGSEAHFQEDLGKSFYSFGIRHSLSRQMPSLHVQMTICPATDESSETHCVLKS